MITDIVVVLIIALVIGGAIFYIRKEKKRGVVCVGCPHAEACAKKGQGGCSGSTNE